MKKPVKISKRNVSSNDIPDELPVMALNKMSKYRSFAFYGRAGTGKTSLALTFPGKVLLLDINDKGTDSGGDIDPEDAVGMKVQEWEDIEMVYYYLKKNPKKYGTVVLDTVTQLQGLCIKHILEKKKKAVAKAGDWGTMTRREWGDVAALMKEWITNYRDLIEIGIEVVFIAQDRVFNQSEDGDDDDSSLAPEIGPRLSPSVSSHLNAEVHVVGNTFIREKTKLVEIKGKKKEVRDIQYCLRVGPNPLYITKVRKPKGIELPDVIKNPSYDKIINIIKGE